VVFETRELVNFHEMWWNLVCFGISVLGMIIRALTIGYTPKGTSGRNTKEGQIAEVLNTKGVYSMVRHPLYLGNFFMWMGLILYAGTPWFVIFCIGFFWIYYERIMFAEEQFIRGKFGQAYLDWSSRTPAFFPNFAKYEASDLTFSIKNVLKREYSGFFATIFSFAYINFIKNFFFDHQIWLDMKWVYGGCIGFVIFITLRSLKKYTRVLHVEGR
jgi:protein-S-isoprenylcysteine O-methyltransferase Ste14